MNALYELGENLSLARQRRDESLRSWSLKMNVSVPTLVRMEKGDPSVGMNAYAAALGLLGLQAALTDIASPKNDISAMERDIKILKAKRAKMKRSNAIR